MSKLPSKFQMAKNLVNSVAKHVSTGAEHVSKDKYEQRLQACFSCPHLIDSERCELCGCYVETKAKWSTATCPDSPQRWDRHVVGEQGKKLNLKK